MKANNFEEATRKTFYSSELLDMVYKDLKKKKISKDTEKVVRLFYEDYLKFVDVYAREQRKKAGCRTFRDGRGKLRLISTGELEKW